MTTSHHTISAMASQMRYRTREMASDCCNSLARRGTLGGRRLLVFVPCYYHLPKLAKEAVWRLALAMAQLCSGVCRREVIQIAIALHKSCCQAQQQPNPAQRHEDWARCTLND